MSSTAGRGDETTPAPNAAARWREVDPSGGGRSGGRLPAVLAAGGCVLAGSGRCDGADAWAATGVGALRRVRSGGRVLMTGLEEGLPEATSTTGMAPRDGGVWQNDQATLV